MGSIIEMAVVAFIEWLGVVFQSKSKKGDRR